MIWLTLPILGLLSLWSARRYQRWRKKQDLYIHREKLQRWVIVPQAKDSQ